MEEGFTAENWRAVPIFAGRVATQADVNAGAAIFALGDTFNGRVLPGEWPQPGIWFDEDEEFAVLIVQAEAHDTEDGETMEVLGLILPSGRTAIALADDVDEVDAADPFWTALLEADLEQAADGDGEDWA